MPARRPGPNWQRPAGGSVQQLDTRPLTDDELRGIDAYWRAANYLSVGRSMCSPTRCSVSGRPCRTALSSYHPRWSG
jgi:hypothetical protein